MTTITIPIKEYRESIQIQQSILSRLGLLQKVILENYKDEISPGTMKRFQSISLNLDKGKGRKFASISLFRNYLKNL